MVCLYGTPVVALEMLFLRIVEHKMWSIWYKLLATGFHISEDPWTEDVTFQNCYASGNLESGFEGEFNAFPI